MVVSNVFRSIFVLGSLVWFGCASNTDLSDPDPNRSGSRDGGPSQPTDGGVLPEDQVVIDDPEEACELGVASTWQAIQIEILDKRGCTSSLCHGTTVNPAGGLDLTQENAYDNLVGVDPQAPVQFDVGQSSIDYKRVFPGEQDLSFLYLKLAAKTLGTSLPQGGGQAMPSGGLQPVSESELELIRKWIRAGAPEGGVVVGTQYALDTECSLTELLSSNKLPPVDPPAPETGVQFYSGAYVLGGVTEDEVCFATYYDFTEGATPTIPAEAMVDCPPSIDSPEGCFAFKSTMLGQDPQSHHSSILPYSGDAGPTDSSWGDWECLGGANNGRSCDPTRFGVPVAQGGADCGSRSACTSSVAHHSPGCWNFGPSDFSALNGAGIGGAQEAISFRSAVDGVYIPMPMKGFLVWNSHAWNLALQNTTIEQWLNVDFAFEDDQSFIRETLVTTPSIAMMGTIAPFTSKEACAKHTFAQYSQVLSLNSHTHLRGVQFRIWEPPHQPCGNGGTCAGDGPLGTAPVYNSVLYNDPLNYEYPSPKALNSSNAADRTYYFCSVFDNGSPAHPEKLKRNSVAVNFGSSCPPSQQRCVGGSNQGAACNGNDGVCGGGGECDACPVGFGVTTEDEMFLMTAEYYIDAP